MGGDEFVLLLPEANYETGEALLKRIRQSLKTTIAVDFPTVGFSIGAITFLSFPDSIDLMLKQADSLMYQVKNSGKNRIKHQIFHKPYSGFGSHPIGS